MPKQDHSVSPQDHPHMLSLPPVVRPRVINTFPGVIAKHPAFTKSVVVCQKYTQATWDLVPVSQMPHCTNLTVH